MKKSFPIYFLFFLFAFVISNSYGQKEKPIKNSQLEIIPYSNSNYVTKGNIKINLNTGTPAAIYGLNYSVTPSTPLKMAFEYLSNNYKQLNIKPNLEDLKHNGTRETPGGYRVHFQQYYGNFPVENSTIVVSINRKNQIVFFTSSYKPNIEVTNINALSTEAAKAIAKNYLGLSGKINLEKSSIVVFYNNRKSKLVNKVSLVPAEMLNGDWEFYIDAETGKIIKAEDKAYYNGGKHSGITAVDASGWVFDPDPISSSGAAYGDPGFTDNGDADSDSLTAHLALRVLPDVTFDGTMYILAGPYAEVVDSESPFTGLHSQDSINFYHTRSNDSFEAANTYYEIDQSMRYINETLGVPLVPFQYTGGVRVDPHGLSGDDNSHYIPSTGEVAFGDGGVDDAEDLYVVLHELGHGIHDWLTNGGISQVDGLSEGCGDYWAMSYLRSFGAFTPADPQYNWAFIWDGHNEFWGGRITNYTAHYPDGLVGQIHTDGQMWASSLMSIYDLIGREATDKNFLEALSMLNSSSSQADAANAFIQADQDLFAGAHLSDIYSVFQARGYVSGPLTVDFEADVTVGGAPLTVNFTDLSSSINGPIISWSWDLDGDGTEDATVQNPSWTYSTPGSYTVSLTASDSSNTLTETKTNYITARDDELIWMDDFEGSMTPDNWTITNNGGSVDWMIFDEPYPNAYTMPTSSSGKVLSADSDEGGSGSTLLSTVTNKTAINATGFRNVILEFDSDWHIFVSADEAIVKVSSDSVNWTQVLHYNGVDARNQHEIIDISAIADSQATVWVSFVSIQPGWDWWWVIDNFSVFGQSGIIPVELTKFSAYESNGSVLLNWETATETNNAGFAVERSTDGKKFSKIAFIQGKGTTSKQSVYTYKDNPSLSGVIYYRLKQMDFDGSYEYSNVIEAKVGLPTQYSLEQNYPNPFNPTTIIGFSLVEAQKVNITVYNAIGEAVAVLINKNFEAGSHKVNFNAANLVSGIYFYRIKAGNFTATKKLVLLR